MDEGVVSESENSVRVHSVERVFRILEELVLHTDMSLKQLAQAAELHKSTTYRLLHTLIDLGYVEQDETQGAYRVGLRLIEMSGKANRAWPINRAAEPIMDRLAAELGESVNVAVEDGLDMVYVATVDAHQPLRMQLNVGRRAPIHCTAVGKAVLAYRSELIDQFRGQKRSLERFTDHTITDWRQLEQELSVIRERGFAIDNEEQVAGALCVAAPIVDYRQRVVAAIGISAPGAHLSWERANEVGPLIAQAARQISERLGYMG